MSTLVSPIDIGGFPFNSSNGDRVYDASDWTDYFGRLIRTGVFREPEGQLLVSCSTGMEVSVASGAASIQGVSMVSDEPVLLTLNYGHLSRARIDRVVLRLDYSLRTVQLGVLEGTPAILPEAPALTRTTEAYELCLCEIRVEAGAVSLNAGCLTDCRANSEVCGWVGSKIVETSTEVLRGINYFASENGGTGQTLTAVCASLGQMPENGVHLTIVPAANPGTGASLRLNGGSSCPIYSSENQAVQYGQLAAGVPVELIYQNGKYFFKSAGGGSFSRSATGTLAPARTFAVNSLSFRPRVVILSARLPVDSSRRMYLTSVGVFQADGTLVLWKPSYPGTSGSLYPDMVWVSSNGFFIQFNALGSETKWPGSDAVEDVVWTCFA